MSQGPGSGGALTAHCLTAAATVYLTAKQLEMTAAPQTFLFYFTAVLSHPADRRKTRLGKLSITRHLIGCESKAKKGECPDVKTRVLFHVRRADPACFLSLTHTSYQVNLCFMVFFFFLVKITFNDCCYLSGVIDCSSLNQRHNYSKVLVNNYPYCNDSRVGTWRARISLFPVHQHERIKCRLGL